MGKGRRDKVLLNTEQRQKLDAIRRNGYAPAKKILHAQVLLMCDEEDSESEPLICMDEAAVQLTGYVFESIPVAPSHDAKEDYHYTREGVQALFMFFDPNRG